MELQLVVPEQTGELMAFTVAALTALTGLVAMLFPRSIAALFGLAANSPDGVGELRGPFAGMMLGTGLAAIMLAQPLVYLALGLGFACAVIGRLISVVVDGARTLQPAVTFAVEAAAAFVLIGYPLGFL